MKLSAILLSIFIIGCSGMRMGIGYHKRPVPAPQEQIFRGIPPGVIEAIIAVIGNENFARIMEAALPPGEVVYFGIYYENL